MASPVAFPLVALLGRDDGARAQLRGALVELGAQVVVEAEPAAARAAQVLDAGTTTVVVNLASGVDEDLEHLQDLFDSPQVNVVFNEAEVSGALEGWDLARWARHLAAKVLGHDNTLPPPPAGAVLLAPDMSAELRPGAPPTPEQQTMVRPIEEFVVEAEFLADDVPQSHLSLDGATPVTISEPEEDFSFEFDLASLESALRADRAAPSADSTPEATAVAASKSGLDFSDFGLSFEPEPVESALVESELVESEPVESELVASELVVAMEVAEEDFIDLPEIETDSLGLPDDSSAAPEAPIEKAAAEEGDADFSFDLDDLDVESISFEEDATRTPAQAPSVSINFSSDGSDLDESTLLDDDVAALAASLDALEYSLPQASEAEDFSLLSLDVDVDESTESTISLETEASAQNAATPPATAPDTADFGSLSLVGLDEEISVAPTAPKASTFNMNLGSGLSLEPIGDEENEVDPLMVAMGLVEAPAASAAKASAASPGLRRVVVLGASIGGPDAVRTFLSTIPESFPAVFLLAQHLENGYFERLAQQLQKSAKLPVGVLGAANVQEGQVYVVPAHVRFTIAEDGAIGSHAHETAPRYTPSIDNLLIEVAQRFGSRATAIIFSGMAGDAIEGAARITAAGGEVWVQDPASCVVSSMVDGAKARGVVEFTGSPRELAEQLVARYGKA